MRKFPNLQLCILCEINSSRQSPVSIIHIHCNYSKTCVKLPLSKRPQLGFKDQQIGFQDQLSLDAGQKYCRSINAGQKYCRMLQAEHSTILLTFIKLPFVIKLFVLFIFEWPFYTGFTVMQKRQACEFCSVSLVSLRHPLLIKLIDYVKNVLELLC